MGPTSAPATTNPPAARRVAPDLTRTTVAAKTQAYWVGVRTFRKADPAKGIEGRPYPPQANFNIGGVTFPSWFTPWDDEGQTRGKFPGAIVRLSAAQVDYLATILARSAVRWREREGQHAHGYVVLLHDDESIEAVRKAQNLNPTQVQVLRAKVPTVAKTFPTDEPAAKYVYMVKVPGDVAAGSTFRPAAELPPCLMDTGLEPF